MSYQLRNRTVALALAILYASTLRAQATIGAMPPCSEEQIAVGTHTLWNNCAEALPTGFNFYLDSCTVNTDGSVSWTGRCWYDA